MVKYGNKGWTFHCTGLFATWNRVQIRLGSVITVEFSRLLCYVLIRKLVNSFL